MTTLEICRNLEWYYSLSEFDFSEFAQPVCALRASMLMQPLKARLEDAGYTVEYADGQRSLLHGWNGYSGFSHKNGPIGTFDTLSDDQTDEINRLICEAERDVLYQ